MSEAMLRLYVTAVGFVQDRYNGRKDRGATAVEYGLLVGLIAVMLIGAFVLLQGSLTNLFGRVTDALNGAGAGGGAA